MRNERPVYNMNLLHVVMALATVLFAAAVVWMVMADHRREWKGYQGTYRDQVEPWGTGARLQLHPGDADTERLSCLLEKQKNTTAKEQLRLPFIDSLGQTLTIDQVRLPGLTLDYHFHDVARVDRCGTCHVGIDRIWPEEVPQSFLCDASKSVTKECCLAIEPREKTSEDPPSDEQTCRLKEGKYDSLGFTLAGIDCLGTSHPTVFRIEKKSPAAEAELQVGDVITHVDGQAVRSLDDVYEQLAKKILPSGEDDDEDEMVKITLSVKRGISQPHAAHPRLDLFVGASSPHPKASFGCTICHDGQGSATDFGWASHSPNTPEERQRWRGEHGWQPNPHWQFPMLPRRFNESSCLKCHHDVVDLNNNDRFPDPPARKLVKGYETIRRSGCFGCHAIDGFDQKDRPMGPDMRLEPLYSEAAGQLLATVPLSDSQRQMAQRVVLSPEDAANRRLLVETIRIPVENSYKEAKEESEEGATPNRDTTLDQLSPTQQRLVELLGSESLHPGTFRKIGAELRHLRGKVSHDYLVDRLADPKRFLPDSRMPRFFGLHNHLDKKTAEEAKQLETAEMHGIATYLLAASQPTAAPPKETETTSNEDTEPNVDLGADLFERQGCLACHQHDDFPDAVSVEGPNLTHIGMKYQSETSQAWLTRWIRTPAELSPRTKMPETFLTASEAASIALYLTDDQETSIPTPPQPASETQQKLATIHLLSDFSAEEAKKILAEGTTPNETIHRHPDAKLLSAPMTEEKLLQYIGRRTIRRRGCFGCHDIPGFEAEKQIGPALSDWGRKQTSLLAFNRVSEYLRQQPPKTDSPQAAAYEKFYRRAIDEQRREGFLWQKLREPRSFDYQQTDQRPFLQWLLMGYFSNLTLEEREAVATFVLGLVAEAPEKPYRYSPDRRTQAIIEGRKIIQKYACGQCHTIQMERWNFAIGEEEREEFEEPTEQPEFPFIKTRLAPSQKAASLVEDYRGRLHAEISGMPQVDEEGELAIVDDDEDDNGNELLMYAFSLWKPEAIAGHTWPVGGADVLVWNHQITRKTPADGGDFPRLLFPKVLEDARELGASAALMEAWGWLPPSLVNEGAMARSDWLHGYLMNPTAIRPAAVLRMPKFNMSSEEATALTNYFAATAGVEFPYQAEPSSDFQDVLAKEKARPNRLRDARKILEDKQTFCAKCHYLGQKGPGDAIKTTLAPDLEKVAGRLRHDYIRRWLANPKSVLPYTGMPVNFPPEGKPLGQDLFPGTSLEQIDAVVDLLLHYNKVQSSQGNDQADTPLPTSNSEKTDKPPIDSTPPTPSSP